MDSSRAHLNRGVALMAQRDLDDARREFEKALETGAGVTALVNLFNVHILLSGLQLRAGGQLIERQRWEMVVCWDHSRLGTASGSLQMPIGKR